MIWASIKHWDNSFIDIPYVTSISLFKTIRASSETFSVEVR